MISSNDLVKTTAEKVMPKSDDLLQDENASLKKSVKCIHLLEQLLKDRDKSLNHLEKTVKNYKLCIEHLQWRLHKHNLDSSVDLKEHEIFEPGHDKPILISLLNDAIRYKRFLDEKFSSEEVAEAKETISVLEKEVSKLCVQLKRKENELIVVLTKMRSSDDEKDVVISKLKCQLRDYFSQRNNDDAVRDTLSSEIRTLKSNTEQFVEEKKKITNELKAYAQREKVWVQERNMCFAHARILHSESKFEDECKTLQEQVRNLSRENTDLCRQLKEIIVMNTRWQKYSEQREAHVVQLKQQLKVSENKVFKNHCLISELERMEKEKRKKEIDTAVLSLARELLLATDLGKTCELN
ncbi:uncharacterized protein [Antedon mediterranea]|uniref:uncharacterized protein n=1 Tax=Antedon mediterranea TaxID=105859 RepID=UPI003AF85E3E